MMPIHSVTIKILPLIIFLKFICLTILFSDTHSNEKKKRKFPMKNFSAKE